MSTVVSDPTKLGVDRQIVRPAILLIRPVILNRLQFVASNCNKAIVSYWFAYIYIYIYIFSKFVFQVEKMTRMFKWIWTLVKRL